MKLLTDDSPTPSAPVVPMSSASPTGVWCEAVGGVLPSGALEGGNDIDGVLFVGRANHEGALIPGKVNPQHGVCYVAWGGEEHGKSDYEVINKIKTITPLGEKKMKNIFFRKRIKAFPPRRRKEKMIV